MNLQPLVPAPKSGLAIVSKAGLSAASPSEYLVVGEDGAPRWVKDPLAATSFASMRDAARMALRLPSGLRAFGLPRDVEMSLHQAH